MSRSIRSLARALAAIVLACLGTGAAVPGVAAGDPCYHGFEMPALTVGESTDVQAMACAFEPTVTTIPAGGSVTFRGGDQPHLVTGANQAWGDRDVELAPGATVTYTFSEPGVYPYSCALHRGMSGAIIVGDGGSALAAAVAGPAVEAGSPPADLAPVGVAVVLVATILGAAVVLRVPRRSRGAPAAPEADALTR